MNDPLIRWSDFKSVWAHKELKWHLRVYVLAIWTGVTAALYVWYYTMVLKEIVTGR